jgi:hypothetical protein
MKFNLINNTQNHISGVIVSILTLSGVVCEFEPWSDQSQAP